MSKTPPHLLISYQLPLPEEAIRSLVDAVKAPGLDLVVEPRPPSGPFAGFEWLLPTAVIVWFGKSYFEGFLKEAGKDHYALVRRGLSSLWPLFFGEGRGVRVTAVGTPGKIRFDEAPYSLGISILGEAGHGLHFKLLFPDDISVEGFNAATASFFELSGEILLRRIGCRDRTASLRGSGDWENDSGDLRPRSRLLQIPRPNPEASGFGLVSPCPEQLPSGNNPLGRVVAFGDIGPADRNQS